MWVLEYELINTKPRYVYTQTNPTRYEVDFRLDRSWLGEKGERGQQGEANNLGNSRPTRVREASD